MEEIITNNAFAVVKTRYGLWSFASGLAGLLIYSINFVWVGIYFDGGAPAWLMFMLGYVSPVVLIILTATSFVFGKKSMKNETGWFKAFGVIGLIISVVACFIIAWLVSRMLIIGFPIIY